MRRYVLKTIYIPSLTECSLCASTNKLVPISMFGPSAYPLFCYMYTYTWLVIRSSNAYSNSILAHLTPNVGKSSTQLVFPAAHCLYLTPQMKKYVVWIPEGTKSQKNGGREKRVKRLNILFDDEDREKWEARRRSAENSRESGCYYATQKFSFLLSLNSIISDRP